MQIFKGKNLTYTKVKNNILRVWELTSEAEKSDWYQQANEIATSQGNKYNHEPSKVCGIMAALSPVKTWSQNIICMEQLLKTNDCGHMKAFKNKARDILKSDGSDAAILKVLNGNKISSFYLNIRYPDKAEIVTIDRHALSIALGYWITDEDHQGMTTKQYEFFVRCYVLAAAKVDVKPLLMQSATWVKWRKIKKNYIRTNLK